MAKVEETLLKIIFNESNIFELPFFFSKSISKINICFFSLKSAYMEPFYFLQIHIKLEIFSSLLSHLSFNRIVQISFNSVQRQQQFSESMRKLTSAQIWSYEMHASESNLSFLDIE